MPSWRDILKLIFAVQEMGQKEMLEKAVPQLITLSLQSVGRHMGAVSLNGMTSVDAAARSILDRAVGSMTFNTKLLMLCLRLCEQMGRLKVSSKMQDGIKQLCVPVWGVNGMLSQDLMAMFTSYQA